MPASKDPEKEALRRKRIGEANRGKVPWNKGIPLAESVRQTLSEKWKGNQYAKGCQFSDEWKERQSQQCKDTFVNISEKEKHTQFVQKRVTKLFNRGFRKEVVRHRIEIYIRRHYPDVDINDIRIEPTPYK